MICQHVIIQSRANLRKMYEACSHEQVHLRKFIWRESHMSERKASWQRFCEYGWLWIIATGRKKSLSSNFPSQFQEIKNRLAESYTYDDVNKVCEDIRNYQLNVSKLPFDLKRSKVRVTESKETIAPMKPNLDDEVDDQLLGLVNSMLKK